jgi:RND family efflux transporter MFP subunit
MRADSVTRSSIALIVLLAVVPAACSGGAEHASAARTDAAPVPVSTTQAASVDMPSSFEAGGVVRARFTAALASRVLATVSDVKVRPGDRVRRGEPLVVLDAREQQGGHDRATAAIAAAEQGSAAAEADIAASEAQLTLARVTHQRIADLASKRSATAQELDQARAALTAAEAQLRGARARRAASEAQLDGARSAAIVAAAQVSYTRIAAPFDGVISERSVDPGFTAVPGAPLLTIEDPSRLRLEVRLDEARAPYVQVGDVVQAATAGSPATTPEGGWVDARVAEIGRVDFDSHTFLVKIDLPDDRRLRTGMFGRVRFAGPSRPVLAVPQTAVVRRGLLAFVYAVGNGTTARLRAVSTGASTGDRLEVLAGLRDGDRIVVEPPPGLVDGARIEAAAPATHGERR